MMLKFRPELFKIQRIDILEVHNTMWIPHRDASHFISVTIHQQWPIFNFALGIDGDFSAFENRLAHIDFDELADDPRSDDPGERFDFELALLRDAVIIDVFGKAPNAVAAHL